MTDQKRDESRDIGYFKSSHVTLPWDCVHPEAVSFERFAPHSDLVAAEAVAKRAVQLLNMIDRGHPDVAYFIETLTAEYFE